MNVYYTPKMLGPPQANSPSAHKPGRVVESWLEIAPRLNLIEPAPVTIEQLCLAHDRDFVTGILSGRLRNGFGNTSREVATSLPYTSGAMLAAARAAIAQRTATIAPCSGFHHASYDEASGFCTFNGLMVTARVLLAEGVAHRVGIFDADMHYGDGTDDILAQTGESRVEQVRRGAYRRGAAVYDESAGLPDRVYGYDDGVAVGPGQDTGQAGLRGLGALGARLRRGRRRGGRGGLGGQGHRLDRHVA